MKISKYSIICALFALLLGLAFHARAHNNTATGPQGSSAPPQFVSPNVYELAGGGIGITYLPTGAGGLAHFTYHDSQRTLSFSGSEVRKVEIPDLGTVVSVTIVKTVDSGSTTFSVLIPKVNLPDRRGATTFISSEGITTLHKFSIAPGLNQGQRDIYSVTTLRGTASLEIIPL